VSASGRVVSILRCYQRTACYSQKVNQEISILHTHSLNRLPCYYISGVIYKLWQANHKCNAEGNCEHRKVHVSVLDYLSTAAWRRMAEWFYRSKFGGEWSRPCRFNSGQKAPVLTG
jgi:hypothetical protein